MTCTFLVVGTGVDPVTFRFSGGIWRSSSDSACWRVRESAGQRIERQQAT
jgi:hypothetical protein